MMFVVIAYLSIALGFFLASVSFHLNFGETPTLRLLSFYSGVSLVWPWIVARAIFWRTGK